MNPEAPQPSSPGFGSESDGQSRDEIPLIRDYELLRRIGKGAYGEVWLARDVLGTYRAVKVVRWRLSENERSYQREFEGLKRFEPVSRLYDSQVDILHVGRNETGGYFFYVMELADDVTSGQQIDPNHYQPRTLRSELERRGRLPLAECAQVGIALTRALEHLHSHGLVHRDVKPDNVIFVNGLPKLADIGLVTGAAATGSIAGTKEYLPPKDPGNPTADLYSLGLTLYEMSTGRSLEDYPKLPEDIGQMAERNELLELNSVFTKAAAYNLRERYQSAREMQKELQTLQAGESVLKSRKRRRLMRAAAYAGAAAVALSLGALWYTASNANAQRQAVLVANLQMLRLADHFEGWYSNVWALTSQAAKLLPVAQARSQAAAALIGVDAKLEKHLGDFGATAVAFSPQGDQLLLSSVTGGVRMLDVRTGVVSTRQVPGRGISFFSSDGKPFQFAEISPLRFQLWDVTERSELGEFAVAAQEIPGLLPEQIKSLAAVTPDGTTFAVGVNFGDIGGRIVVWKTATHSKLAEFNCNVTALALSADGQLVAGGDNDGQITVWSVAGGPPLAAYLVDNTPVRSLAFGRDRVIRRQKQGDESRWLLASGSAGTALAIYSSSTKFARAVCRGSHYDVYSLAFSPDSTVLASGGREHRGSVRMWDAATGRQLLALHSGEFVASLAFSPDGRRLAASSVEGFGRRQGEVCVWELEPGRGIRSLRGLSAPNTRLCFSRDGRLVAALAQNWQVGIWEVQTAAPRCILEVPIGLVADNAAFAFSLDARFFAFATGTEACMWETKTWRLVRSWPLPPGLVDRVAFASTNRLLLFRHETVGGKAAPTSDFDRAKYPRVCRVRDLLAADPLHPILELSDFNLRAANAEMTAGGEYLVVEGLREREGRREAVCIGEDLEKGKRLWQIAYPSPEGRGMEIETAGNRVFIQTNEAGPALVLDLVSGNQVGTLQCVPSCALHGLESWLRLGPVPEFSRGWSLMSERVGNRPVLALGIDTQGVSPFPKFSSDGNLVAWGSSDGTVFVADLAEVRQHLGEIGIGW